MESPNCVNLYIVRYGNCSEPLFCEGTEQIQDMKNNMAVTHKRVIKKLLAGFEPATYALRMRRSTS